MAAAKHGSAPPSAASREARAGFGSIGRAAEQPLARLFFGTVAGRRIQGPDINPVLPLGDAFRVPLRDLVPESGHAQGFLRFALDGFLGEFAGFPVFAPPVRAAGLPDSLRFGDEFFELFLPILERRSGGNPLARFRRSGCPIASAPWQGAKLKVAERELAGSATHREKKIDFDDTSHNWFDVRAAEWVTFGSLPNYLQPRGGGRRIAWRRYSQLGFREFKSRGGPSGDAGGHVANIRAAKGKQRLCGEAWAGGLEPQLRRPVRWLAPGTRIDLGRSAGLAGHRARQSDSMTRRLWEHGLPMSARECPESSSDGLRSVRQRVRLLPPTRYSARPGHMALTAAS